MLPKLIYLKGLKTMIKYKYIQWNDYANIEKQKSSYLCFHFFRSAAASMDNSVARSKCLKIPRWGIKNS